MAAVERLCERTAWVKSGNISQDGLSQAVVENYLREMQGKDMSDKVVSRDRDFFITRVATIGQDGEEKREFYTGENLRIELDYQCAKNFPGALIYIGIANRDALLFAANMCLDGCRLISPGERGKLSVTFKELPLAPQQQYRIRIGGRAWDNRTPLFDSPHVEVGNIRVVGSTADISLKGENSEILIGNSSSVLVPYEWDLGNGHVYKIQSFKNVKLLAPQIW